MARYQQLFLGGSCAMITIIIYKRKFVAPTFLPLYLIFKTKLPNSKIPGSQVCDGGDNGGNVWWQCVVAKKGGDY